ncbi:hypothetical protein K3495_g2035 [Podosphaera aphanis]|nr:hypothetical protein K3495_g2035 [Podosphaera aphanis]
MEKTLTYESVALVQEKTRFLRKITEGIPRKANASSNLRPSSLWLKRGDEDSIRVVGFFGGSKSKTRWADCDIAVCTIEKANSLVNAAVEENSCELPAVVVIDELHMTDDESRGYILELMASKILSLNENVQIIGMSATLNNPEVLAKWLRAKFYISQYKPVPIEENLVVDNYVYPAATSSMFYKTAAQLTASSSSSSSSSSSNQKSSPRPCRIIQPSINKELKNPLLNSVVSLTIETANAGHGALVFCSSRAGCERNASLISLAMPQLDRLDLETIDRRLNLVNDLRNAGLTSEERDLIATAYDQGVLRVLVATCSLAAGINLPARRVILHGARMGADFVGPSLLRQMKGRAGRKGKDEIGETFLCCNQSDIEAVAELMEANLPQIESCLVPGKRGIRRALLEAIATRIATCSDSIRRFMNNTLLHLTTETSDFSNMIQSSLKELVNDGLIRCVDETEYTSTRLGGAIVASSLSPEDGLFLYGELRKALRAFVMDGEMHVLYTFTPIQTTQTSINWQTFRTEIENLDENDLRVLEFLGLKPGVINKMARGGSLSETTPQEAETARIYRRFYAALQLRDLCNEVPIYAVARKYDIPRGNVQNLAQSCQGFAAGMIKFCERMEWGALGAVLDHFSDRLKAGAKCDLLALAEVKFIKSKTARIFWDNGFKSVGALAAAEIPEILTILLLAQPRKPKTSKAQEEKYIQKLRSKAEIISASATKIWEKQMQAELDKEDE